MHKPLFKFLPLLLVVFLTVLTCYAAEEPGLWKIAPTPSVGRAVRTLDSAEPDTIFYDDGWIVAFYQAHNLWARMRFTAPYDLDLRSVYFVVNNPNNVAHACSVCVHLAASNYTLGAMVGAFQFPGIVVHFGTNLHNPIWNDFTLPSPITVAAGQDFYIVLGPQPGGQQNQGWHILLDGDATPARSSFSVFGHFGSYSPTGGDFMIRAGIAPLNAPAHGYVTLLSSGPPEWHYQLNRISGAVTRFVLSNFCPGTLGSVTGLAQQFEWSAASYTDSVVFTSPNAMPSNSLMTFVLTHPTCSDQIRWTVGDSSGTVDGPLPVELLSFSAEPAEGAVQLHFVTASENTNSYFEIYRSESAEGEFQVIAQLPSHGNSSTQQNYDYRDASVLPGKTYWYYLADVSVSGEHTPHRDWMRSAGAGVSAVVNSYSLSAYPNPFNPTTTLEFTLPEASRVSLRVFDVTGKLVRTVADAPYDAGRHTAAFDASALPSGIYIAQLQAGSVNLTRKLMLVK